MKHGFHPSSSTRAKNHEEDLLENCEGRFGRTRPIRGERAFHLLDPGRQTRSSWNGDESTEVWAASLLVLAPIPPVNAPGRGTDASDPATAAVAGERGGSSAPRTLAQVKAPARCCTRRRGQDAEIGARTWLTAPVMSSISGAEHAPSGDGEGSPWRPPLDWPASPSNIFLGWSWASEPGPDAGP